MRATAHALSGRKGGNGSLMRTAAVGIAYLDDEAGCLEAAALVSSLTHDDDRAEQACQLWSFAIRQAVLTGTFDGVRGFLEIADSDVARYWGPVLDQAENGAPRDFPKNGWVVHALQTAWWAITHADQGDAQHLQAALELAVRAGHDTDTTAAIAGALLGARWGASAVPARWRRILHGWPGLRAKDLIGLAALTANSGASGHRGVANGRSPGVPRLADRTWTSASSARCGCPPGWLRRCVRRCHRRGGQPVPHGFCGSRRRARRVLADRRRSERELEPVIRPR